MRQKQQPGPVFYTQKCMADLLGAEYWNVRYIVRTRKIQAAMTIGGFRLFDENAVAEVRQFLQEIAWRNRRSSRSARRSNRAAATA